MTEHDEARRAALVAAKTAHVALIGTAHDNFVLGAAMTHATGALFVREYADRKVPPQIRRFADACQTLDASRRTVASMLERGDKMTDDEVSGFVGMLGSVNRTMRDALVTYGKTHGRTDDYMNLRDAVRDACAAMDRTAETLRSWFGFLEDTGARTGPTKH